MPDGTPSTDRPGATTNDPLPDTASAERPLAPTNDPLPSAASSTSGPVAAGDDSLPNTPSSGGPVAATNDLVPKQTPAGADGGRGSVEDEPVSIGLRDGGEPGERAGFRLAAFGALLVVVLFAGYGLGRLNDGTAATSAPAGAGAASRGAVAGMAVDESQPHQHNADGTVGQGGVVQPMGAAVGGLSLSSGGLTLRPSATSFTAGRRQRLAFRIEAAGGAAVTTYAVVHDRPLHLILIRRDLSGFQHLHPTMAADGTWSIDLTLAEPGSYRMIADFTAVLGGQQLATTLGSDLTVSGDYVPRELPAPVLDSSTDGFAVRYEGTLGTASTQPMLISVTGTDGKPAAVEPYLGAYGHLVVLREGDVAYVHVHPETQLVDGRVKFWVTLPSEGTYRMFFDFQVAGTVHTAAWTAEIG
jgi:hypothetical protein